MPFIKKLLLSCLAFVSFSLIIWFIPRPLVNHDKPRNLPWQLPNYKIAKTSIKTLSDGRIKIEIEHLPLIGITPKMISWFYKNLPISTVELSGNTYPLYHIFHPFEHGAIKILEPAKNGSLGMGIGALVSRQEWFGTFDSTGAGRVVKFDSQHMVIKPEKFGLHFGTITHRFKLTENGTQYNVSSIIGSDLLIIGPLINLYIRHKMFPPAMLEEWLRHQVQEVSSLQFFLIDLYHSQFTRTKFDKTHYKLKLTHKLSNKFNK